MERLNEVKDDLAKYGMLRALQDRNEVLFYHVLSNHVRETNCNPTTTCFSQQIFLICLFRTTSHLK
jgi:hypothetical protein